MDLANLCSVKSGLTPKNFKMLAKNSYVFKNGHSATLAKDGGNPLCCVSSFERGSTTWRRLFDQLANYLQKKINFKNLAVAL